MRNKYLIRGLFMVLTGLALGYLGWYLKHETDIYYGWAMIGGVVTFGIGFLTIFYSLIRSVEYHSIIEDRASHAK